MEDLIPKVTHCLTHALGMNPRPHAREASVLTERLAEGVDFPDISESRGFSPSLHYHIIFARWRDVRILRALGVCTTFKLHCKSGGGNIQIGFFKVSVCNTVKLDFFTCY